MTLPFYKDGAEAAQAVLSGSLASAHTGLWYTRFYNAYQVVQCEWTVGDEGKRGWIDKTVNLGLSGDTEQIHHLRGRQRALCLALGGLAAELETDGPFVTGLGLSHPVENGFSFHPTLGVAYLPASGIKGLLRAWVEAWMEHADDVAKKALIERWFGTTKDSSASSSAGTGNLIFFDALPTRPVVLGCDIMTPHMGRWYEGGAEISEKNYATTLPADWHSPVPVPFLVVKKAHFEFLIAPRLSPDALRNQQIKEDLASAMMELKNALEWIGAGAKTAVGYGRMLDRADEKNKALAADMAEAGIHIGQEQWDTANLVWNKGQSTFTASSGNDRTAALGGSQAKAKWHILTEATQARLLKGKPVVVKASVERHGNSITLIAIKEV